MRIVDWTPNDRKWAYGVVCWLDDLFEIERDYGFKELANMFRRYADPPCTHYDHDDKNVCNICSADLNRWFEWQTMR